MRLNLANKFFIISFLLYLTAGIMALLKMGYSILVLLAAIIFLAFGFFNHSKAKWKKLFKRST